MRCKFYLKYDDRLPLRYQGLEVVFLLYQKELSTIVRIRTLHNAPVKLAGLPMQFHIDFIDCMEVPDEI